MKKIVNKVLHDGKTWGRYVNYQKSDTGLNIYIYIHERYPCIIERVTLVFKRIYMKIELNYKKVIMEDRVICINWGLLRKNRRSIQVTEERNQVYHFWIWYTVHTCNKCWVGRMLMTNVHDNGASSLDSIRIHTRRRIGLHLQNKIVE